MSGQRTYILVLTILFSDRYQRPIEGRKVHLLWILHATRLNNIERKHSKTIWKLPEAYIYFLRHWKTDPDFVNFDPNNFQCYLLRVGVHLGNNDLKDRGCCRDELLIVNLAVKARLDTNSTQKATSFKICCVLRKLLSKFTYILLETFVENNLKYDLSE